mgnify:FL=1
MNLYNNLSPRKQYLVHYLGWMLAGNVIFAFGVNVIITPMNLYNGGFTGMAQLLRLLFVNVFHMPEIPGVDIVGILYFLLNLPLLIISYKVVNKEFCITSVISITLCSVALGVMPVPKTPIFNDYLTACLIGGVVAGTGAGMVLRAGSSQGGQDIIGVIVSVLNPNYSVGKISIMINIGIYIICLFIFNIEIVAYSLIYTTILAMSLDRVHIQNINMQVMIFTKKPGVEDVIMSELRRGVTNWNGIGAYTKEDSNVIVTIIAKYEITKLLMIVKQADPDAFVVVNEGAQIYGNFEKRLTK